jgi:hypothetical protein
LIGISLAKIAASSCKNPKEEKEKKRTGRPKIHQTNRQRKNVVGDIEKHIILSVYNHLELPS